jgi:hypothetical protein
VNYETDVLQPAATAAAEAAIDAYGPDGCEAELAYIYIRDLWLDDTKPQAEYLPERMPAAFAALYAEALIAERRTRV